MARPVPPFPARVCFTEAGTRPFSEEPRLRERFDAGTGLVALGAVLLLVSLFVNWYDPGGDAWAVFESVDLLLAAAAVACLIAVVPRYAALQRAVPVIAFAAL